MTSLETTKRGKLYLVIMLAILSVYAVLSVRDARSAQQRLRQTRGDLDEIAVKLQQIERLRQSPKVAALRLESPAEITNRISAARQTAGLPQSALLKSQPQEPMRIERSDFKLRATHIDLRPQSLTKIVAFCDALRDAATGTVVRDLILTAPRDESSRNGDNRATQEAWEAQLVLTQTIYSPKSR